MPSFDLTVLSSAYTNTYSKREQWGVYVQDQVALGRLQLIAAGRQDWYRQDSFNKKNGTASVLSQRPSRGASDALRHGKRAIAFHQLFAIF
jgi:iron complex outermembrane receptor protein